MTLTEQIRRKIETCGQSMYEIAEKTGISYPVIYRFVKGERGVTVKTLDVLCKYLKIKIQ